MSKYIGYQKVLQEQVKELLETDSPIILFGTMALGQMAKKALEFLGRKAVCFCDNDKSRQNTVVDGLIVLSSEKAREQYPDAFVFICSFKQANVEKIKSQLQNLGFNHICDKDVLFYVYQTQANSRNISSRDYADAIDILNNKKDMLTIENVFVILTEKCSLHCKDCGRLIPYYKNPQNYDKNEIINSMKRLSASVDAIRSMVIFGGEPFLHPDIAEICIAASNLENVSLVNIVTNGTIVPKDDILKKISNLGLYVVISDYGSLSTKKRELEAALESHGIIYDIAEQNSKWYPVAPPKKYGRSIVENKKLYKNCAWGGNCPELQNGEFHICGYSATGTKLGRIPKNGSGYVDVLDPNLSISEIRESLDKLINHTTCITACDYCGFDFQATTARAVQVNRILELE
ncbi:MAG: radical SAM protein [Bacillota bacterium]